MDKKYIISILLFFLLSLSLLGQDRSVSEADLSSMPLNEDKVEILLDLAWNYKSNDSEKALLYGKSALQIAKKLTHQKLIADASHTIGMVYWYRSNYENASKYFFDALRIRQVINDELGLSRSYNNIGNLFFRQKDYEEALNYYSNGLEIRKVMKDSAGLIYSYSNVADVFAKQGLIDGAEKNYSMGLAIARKLNHFRGEAFVLYRWGLFLKSNAKIDSSAILFNQALSVARANNEKGQLSLNLVELAEIDNNVEDFEGAVEKAVIARGISEQLGAKETLAKACKQLSIAYAGLEQFELAYRDYLTFSELSQELSSTETERTIQEVQNNFKNTSEKLNLSEEVRKWSRNALILLILLLLMMVIAGISLLLRYRGQRYHNQILRERNEHINMQNEALLRSNSALEQFAYVASHDLKEPLRNINTYSFLLSENMKGKINENAKQYLRFISQGAKHMDDLLRGILSYSRLTQNTHAHNEVIDLNSTLSDVQNTLKNIIKEKNVVFEVDELPDIHSNEMQMYQLFQNLISNGIKFNDKKQPVIQIRYQKKNDGHYFEFQDNGIGFEEKYAAKVFQIFQRLEGRKYSGTGVGMAICKNIVSQHGGRINVSSKLGTGTTFFVYLPFMDPSENNLIL